VRRVERVRDLPRDGERLGDRQPTKRLLFRGFRGFVIFVVTLDSSLELV